MSDPVGLTPRVAKSPLQRSTVGESPERLLGTGYTEASSLKTGNVNGGQQFGQQGKLATGKGKTGKRGKPVQNKYPGTPLPSDGEANRRKKEEEQESAARVKADEIAMELMLDEANVGDERGVSKKKSSDKKQKRKKDKGAKTDPGGESGIDGSPVIGSDTGRRASDDVDSARLTFGQATFGMRSKSPSPPAAADAPPVTVALQLSIGPERADEAVDVRVEASAHSIRRDEEDDTPRDTQSTAPAPATPAAMGDETWEPVVSKKDKRASRKTLAELPSATEAPRHRGVASSSASDCSASASASDTGSASSTAATFLVVSAAPMNDSAPTELQPTAAAHARPGVVASPAPALPTSASSRRGWETACKQPIAEKPCTTLSCCPSVASVAAGKSPPVAALSDDTAWSAANGTGRAFNAWAGAAPTEGMQVQSEPDWPSLDDAPRSKDVAGSAPASDASPVQTAANMTQASPAAASPRSSTSSVPAVGRLAEQKPGLTPTVPRVAAQRSAPAFSWASVAKKGIHSEKETKTPSVAAAKGYTVLSGSATHLSAASVTSAVSGSTAAMNSTATATAPTATSPGLPPSPPPSPAIPTSPTSASASACPPAPSSLDLSSAEQGLDVGCCGWRRQTSSTSGTQTSPPTSPLRATSFAQNAVRAQERSMQSQAPSAVETPGGPTSPSLPAPAEEKSRISPQVKMEAPSVTDSEVAGDVEIQAGTEANVPRATTLPAPKPKPPAWAGSDARMAAVTAPPPGSVPLAQRQSSQNGRSPPRPASAPAQPVPPISLSPQQKQLNHTAQTPPAQQIAHSQQQQQHHPPLPQMPHEHQQHQIQHPRYAQNFPYGLNPHGMLPPAMAHSSAFTYVHAAHMVDARVGELSEAERIQRSTLLAAAEAQHVAAAAGTAHEAQQAMLLQTEAGHAFEVWAAASGVDSASGKKVGHRQGRSINGSPAGPGCNNSSGNSGKIMSQQQGSRAQHPAAQQRMGASPYTIAATQSQMLMTRGRMGVVPMTNVAQRNGQCACTNGPMSHSRNILHTALHHQPTTPPVNVGNMSRLHDEIMQFASANLSGCSSSHDDINAIMASLKAVVNKHFPSASVELYGSRSTGLFLNTSDMDVVLMGVPCTPKDVGEALTRLRDDLLAESWVTSHMLVLSARIPVLKLRSNIGVPVDITISASLQHTGLQARDLLLSYLTDSPQLAPLVVVFKTFLRDLGLNDPYTGGLSSYCLVVLLYNFLRESPQFGFSTTDCGYLLYGFLTMFVFRFESNLAHVDDPLAPSHQLEDGSVVIGENIMHSCYQIGRVCHIFRLAMAALSPENGAWEQSDSPLLPKFFAVANGNRIGNMATQTDPLGERRSPSSQTDLTDPRLIRTPDGSSKFPTPATSASRDANSIPTSRVTVTVSAASGDVSSSDSPGVVCTARPSAAVSIAEPPHASPSCVNHATPSPKAIVVSERISPDRLAVSPKASLNSPKGFGLTDDGFNHSTDKSRGESPISPITAPAGSPVVAIQSPVSASLPAGKASTSWAAAAALPPADGADRPPSRPSSRATSVPSPSMRPSTPPPSPAQRGTSPSPKLPATAPASAGTTPSSTPKASTPKASTPKAAASSPFAVAAAARAADAAAVNQPAREGSTPRGTIPAHSGKHRTGGGASSLAC